MSSSNMISYPCNVPCVWLALDLDDQVAAFMTDGTGLIPLDVLKLPMGIEEMWEAIDRMVPYRDPTRLGPPFLSQGMHCYSWDSTLVYVASGIPSGEPLTLGELPPALHDIASQVRLQLRFRDTPAIPDKRIPYGLCMLGD